MFIETKGEREGIWSIWMNIKREWNEWEWHLKRRFSWLKKKKKILYVQFSSSSSLFVSLRVIFFVTHLFSQCNSYTPFQSHSYPLLLLPFYLYSPLSFHLFHHQNPEIITVCWLFPWLYFLPLLSISLSLSLSNILWFWIFFLFFSYLKWRERRTRKCIMRFIFFLSSFSSLFRFLDVPVPISSSSFSLLSSFSLKERERESLFLQRNEEFLLRPCLWFISLSLVP